jgi:tRNA/rRNA methyltransferase
MEIVFILSHPAVEENIGAAARALKTMGFGRLRLVSPVDHLSVNARKLAHGAGVILERAEVFDTTADAVAGLDFLIGTTAKTRNIRQEYLPADQLKGFLQERKTVISKAGILFGSEESGLSNEEIGLCDILSYIPLAAPYPSLNLAQAVMLYAWELSMLPSREVPKEKKETPAAYHILKKRTEKLLPLLGIHEARPIYHRILERLALAGETDLHLLLSVTEALQKKLER